MFFVLLWFKVEHKEKTTKEKKKKKRGRIRAAAGTEKRREREREREEKRRKGGGREGMCSLKLLFPQERQQQAVKPERRTATAESKLYKVR